MKKIVLFGLAAGVAGVLSAQETPKLALSAGAGFSTPLGNTGSNLDTGWNIRGGVGYNFSPYFGALLDFGYDSMGVNSGVLSNLGYGGGNLNIFSMTLDPVVHLNPKGHVDVYVTGGGGYFRQEQQFTQPGVASSFVGNPFFGYYPVTYGTNIVVSDYTVNKPGVDGGIGVAFGSKWGGKFFAEARYERIFTGNYHTDYLPVTFGFRR
jgi:hypothetical protein